MKNFLKKKTRFLAIALSLTLLLSGGIAALALTDQPVSVPALLSNVSLNLYGGNVSSNIYGGNVSVNIYGHTEIEALPAPTADADAATSVVASAATALEAATGMTMRTVGAPIVVSVERPNTVAVLSVPAGFNTSTVTTMAVLNTDSTLTPIPTRVDASGNLVVLVSGSAVLVPLSVEANFRDIDFGPQFANVTSEINLAASMMIIQGRGQAMFAPSAHVTGQDAATMFLRAMGVPVQWETAIATAVEVGITDGSIVAASPLSRISTAVMIHNALETLGVAVEMTPAQVNATLANFTDLDGLTNAQRLAMAVCIELGIFRGAGDGLMNPNQSLQRSAVASLSVRLQDVFLGM